MHGVAAPWHPRRDALALTLSLTLPLLLGGCQAPTPAVPACGATPSPAPGLSHTIRPFLNGSDAGEGRAASHLFRCAQEWEAYCALWMAGRGSCERLDFALENVLVAWGPPQPSTQHRLRITAIDEAEGDWTVFYKVLVPTPSSPGGACTSDALASRPFQAAAMSRAFSMPDKLHLVRQANATFACDASGSPATLVAT